MELKCCIFNNGKVTGDLCDTDTRQLHMFAYAENICKCSMFPPELQHKSFQSLWKQLLVKLLSQKLSSTHYLTLWFGLLLGTPVSERAKILLDDRVKKTVTLPLSKT